MNIPARLSHSPSARPVSSLASRLASRLDARRGRRLACFALMPVFVLLTACASDDPDRSGVFEPYRINLPQGNYVTQEMLRQVRPGMSREQVRFALGSPLLNQTFRADRWDYVYRFQHASGRSEVRRVMIRFADEKVAQIEADALPVRDDASDPALPGSKAAMSTGGAADLATPRIPAPTAPPPSTSGQPAEKTN
jgi:outer membrane protein assembly factor BamE